jgi:hypothetical protein
VRVYHWKLIWSDGRLCMELIELTQTDPFPSANAKWVSIDSDQVQSYTPSYTSGNEAGRSHRKKRQRGVQSEFQNSNK